MLFLMMRAPASAEPCQDEILHLLSASEGDVLDDDTLAPSPAWNARRKRFILTCGIDLDMKYSLFIVGLAIQDNLSASSASRSQAFRG